MAFSCRCLLQRTGRTNGLNCATIRRVTPHVAASRRRRKKGTLWKLRSNFKCVLFWTDCSVFGVSDLSRILDCADPAARQEIAETTAAFQAFRPGCRQPSNVRLGGTSQWVQKPFWLLSWLCFCLAEAAGTGAAGAANATCCGTQRASEAGPDR